MFFSLIRGVRQGGVLSPYLFARFIGSVADKVKLSGIGCYVNMTCMSILLYADDILLVAPSVASLQRILSICEYCEAELDWLDVDVRINPKKSSCIRFGACFVVECSNISTSDDSKLPWNDNLRYVGVYLRSSRSFACSFSHVKHSYVSYFQHRFRESWANCISGCCSPTC